MTASIIIVLSRMIPWRRQSLPSRHLDAKAAKILLQYWEWWLNPFPSIVDHRRHCPKKRLCRVELDLYGLGPALRQRGSRGILPRHPGTTLKAGSVFFVKARPMFRHLSRRSRPGVCRPHLSPRSGALSLDQITHEQWIHGDLDRTEAGVARRALLRRSVDWPEPRLLRLYSRIPMPLLGSLTFF